MDCVVSRESDACDPAEGESGDDTVERFAVGWGGACGG